jgi:hypothetical protein
MTREAPDVPSCPAPTGHLFPLKSCKNGPKCRISPEASAENRQKGAKMRDFTGEGGRLELFAQISLCPRTTNSENSAENRLLL